MQKKHLLILELIKIRKKEHIYKNLKLIAGLYAGTILHQADTLSNAINYLITTHHHDKTIISKL